MDLMKRIIELVFVTLALILILSLYPSSNQLPPGYVWSAQLGKPGALQLNERISQGISPSGWYDYMVTTVGDNWCISRPSGISSTFQPRGANVSVRYRSSFQDPSCGWMIWRRGPYPRSDAPENVRGVWK